MIVEESVLKTFLGLGASITAEEQSVLSLLHPMVEGWVRDYIRYDPEHGTHTEFYPHHLNAGGHSSQYSAGYSISGDRAVINVVSNVRHQTLQLRNLPIRAVTTVHVDADANHGDAPSAFADSTLLVSGVDYWVDWDQDGICRTGHLHSNGLWPNTPGTVKVVYTAGYTATELLGTDSGPINAGAIGWAVITAAMKGMHTFQAWKKDGSTGWQPGPLQSEKLGDYSYSLGGNSAAAVVGLLNGLPQESKEMLDVFVHCGEGVL